MSPTTQAVQAVGTPRSYNALKPCISSRSSTTMTPSEAERMSSNKPQKDQRGERCWGYVRVVSVGSRCCGM